MPQLGHRFWVLSSYSEPHPKAAVSFLQVCNASPHTTLLLCSPTRKEVRPAPFSLLGISFIIFKMDIEAGIKWCSDLSHTTC